MAISLKALYDQVQSISLSGVKSVSKSKSGYMEFHNGVILNWGETELGSWGGSAPNTPTYNFAKPFPNAVIGAYVGEKYNRQHGNYNPVCITQLTTTSISFQLYERFSGYWIAIGY